MFRKLVTTVAIDGSISKEERGTVDAEDATDDMHAEHMRISDIARSDRGTRILTVEQTDNTVIVIYVHGAVKVYHWVAE